MRELRFAVVLYGGVSLAVYINGVVQELYNLVRATAPAGDYALVDSVELRSTEGVYRALGQMHPSQAKGAGAAPTNPEPGAPILRRFVVDLISGSSAGGINGVYLSKALSNGQPISQLKQFWIDEADIGVLVNDKQSIREVDHGVLDDPPRSLLNGNRMYYKLLEALDRMDVPDGTPPLTTADFELGTAAETLPAGLVDELDLFVTATDFTGVLDRFKLANGVATESNHRRVWRLRHGVMPDGTLRHDFGFAANPFLAFAARATSSFPYAFAPVSLEQVRPIATHFSGHADPFPADLLERVLTGFSDEQQTRTQQRVFGDGGALDNSPFTMVIEALASRRSEVPVERKLVYVEPDPADLDESPVLAHPNAVEGTLELAVLLPRRQTIGEDLQRVRQRNEVASRLLDLIGRIDDDATARGPEYLAAPPATLQEWLDQEPSELALRSAFRLKWRTAIAELARMIARGSSRLTSHSDDVTAVEQRLVAWATRYVEAASFPAFRNLKEMLLGLDFGYRLRRTAFVKRRADELFELDERAHQLATTAGASVRNLSDVGQREFRDALRRAKVDLDHVSALLAALRMGWERVFEDPRNVDSVLAALARMFDVDTDSADLQASLDAVRADVLESLQPDVVADALGAVLAAPDDASARAEAGDLIAQRVVAAAHQLLPAQLREYLDHTNTGEVTITSGDTTASPADALADASLEGLYRAVAAVNCLAFAAASRRTAAMLPEPSQLSDSASVARGVLRYYYERYEPFDQALLPVWSTFDGELAAVEVMRISPIDARDLVKDRAARKRKLAGRAYAHFGAFFERSWRRNDILWGRLDAAEILISSLAPSGPLAEKLLADARRQIVEEELGHSPALASEVVRALLLDEPADGGLASTILPGQRRVLVEEAVGDALQIDQLVGTLAQVPAAPPADGAAMVNTAGRSLEVTAKVLRGVTDSSTLGPVTAAASAVGFAVAHLAAGLAPRSIGRVLRSYWTTLVLVAGLLLLTAGYLLGVPSATTVGWITVGAVAVLLAASRLVPRILHGGKRWIAVGVAVAVLAVGGAGFALGRWSSAGSPTHYPYCVDHDRPASADCQRR